MDLINIRQVTIQLKIEEKSDQMESSCLKSS